MVYKIFIRGCRNIRRKIKSNKLRWIYLDLDISLNERPEPPKNFITRRLFPTKILNLAFLDDYFNRLTKSNAKRQLFVRTSCRQIWLQWLVGTTSS